MSTSSASATSQRSKLRASRSRPSSRATCTSAPVCLISASSRTRSLIPCWTRLELGLRRLLGLHHGFGEVVDAAGAPSPRPRARGPGSAGHRAPRPARPAAPGARASACRAASSWPDISSPAHDASSGQSAPRSPVSAGGSTLTCDERIALGPERLGGLLQRLLGGLHGLAVPGLVLPGGRFLLGWLPARTARRRHGRPAAAPRPRDPDAPAPAPPAHAADARAR